MKLIIIGMIKMFLFKKGRIFCYYLNFIKILFLFINIFNFEFILYKIFFYC